MRNKKSQPSELIKQTSVTIASRIADTANIKINIENALNNLKELSETYFDITDFRGVLNKLQTALGLQGHNGPSKYGAFLIGKDHYTIRISNHNANASHYKGYNDETKNISIVISRRYKKYRFFACEEISLDEYVYYERKLRNINNPIVLIIESIEEFLLTGQYIDKTNMALINHSDKIK